MFIPFNRTILELKLEVGYIYLVEGNTFNRTILELKQESECSRLFNALLLIEPYWN